MHLYHLTLKNGNDKGQQIVFGAESEKDAKLIAGWRAWEAFGGSMTGRVVGIELEPEDKVGSLKEPLKGVTPTVSDFATNRVEDTDPNGRSPLDVAFVNNEINWRSEHIRSRTRTLIAFCQLYVLLMTAYCGYWGAVMRYLSDVTWNVKWAAVVIGIGLMTFLIMSGMALTRLCGYVFCSNMMNRKRMIMLRAEYAKDNGVLQNLPHPHCSDEVWSCRGVNFVPYLVMYINLGVLLLTVAFAEFLFENFLLPSIIGGMTLLVFSVFYPHVCFLYKKSIWIGRNFGDGVDSRTHDDLRDEYRKTLIAKNVEFPGRLRRLKMSFTLVAITFMVALFYSIRLSFPIHNRFLDWLVEPSNLWSWGFLIGLSIATFVLRGITLSTRLRVPKERKKS